MKRNQALLKKRRDFVIDYINANKSKQMKVVILELSEMLFLTERTIYNILTNEIN